MTKRPASKNSSSPRVVRPSPRPTREPVPQERPTSATTSELAPAQGTTANRATIRVEIDSEIDCWSTYSRFDVLLRGLITASSPIDLFAIRDKAGREIALVQFGQEAEREAVTLAGAETAFRRGFQVFLPMPVGDSIRIADMWVSARGRDGAVFEEAMRLGCRADQAAILAGPARAMPGAEIPEPAGIVYLESAVISVDGLLLVQGWTLAASPSMPANTTCCASPLIDLLTERNDVSVLLVGGRDDEEKAASIMAQVARPDRIASVARMIPARI